MTRGKPSVGLCDAVYPHPNGVNEYRCRKRLDHLLSKGPYTRKHTDTKSPPTVTWEATEEEIESAKAKIGALNEEARTVHSGDSRKA